MPETTETEIAARPNALALEAKVIADVTPILERLTTVAKSVTDDATCAVAVSAMVEVSDITRCLQADRATHYEPIYREAEAVRAIYDPRLKLAKLIKDQLGSAVTNYRLEQQRLERLRREEAEAKARREREEAERKQREAEALAAKIKADAEAEKERQRKAKEDEERRVKEAQEAQARADQAERDRIEAERQRRVKSEEDARLAHAQEAERVGSGHRVETILDRATPIAAVAPEVKVETESERHTRRLALEQEEKDRQSREAQEVETRRVADNKRKSDEESLAKAQADAEEAKRKAAEAQAAATKSVAAPRDGRETQVTRWGYRVRDEAAFRALARAVADGRKPVKYLGFDPINPGAFRSAAIQKDVTEDKAAFQCDGVEAFPETKTQIKSMEAA